MCGPLLRSQLNMVSHGGFRRTYVCVREEYEDREKSVCVGLSFKLVWLLLG